MASPHVHYAPDKGGVGKYFGLCGKTWMLLTHVKKRVTCPKCKKLMKVVKS